MDFPLKRTLFQSAVLISFTVLLCILLRAVDESSRDEWETGRLTSHVVCHGHNHTNRRCTFRNLCYRTDSREFVFFVNQESVRSGLPSNRFEPALAELSSVNNHNRYFFNFVDVLSVASIRLKESFEFVDVIGETQLMGRFKPDNLMHFLHDDIFPLIDTLKQLAVEKQEVSIFFFDEWSNSFNFPMMHFGTDVYSLVPAQSFLTPDQFPGRKFVCFRKAHVGLSKETTWYDYGFHRPQAPLPPHGQEVTLRKTLDSIMKTLSLSDKECDARTVILISRKKTRIIVNEKQVVHSLSAATGLEIVTLRLEEVTDFRELVRTVRCAKVLIGMHGSGLVLSAFLARDSAVIEIFPYAINPDHYTPYKRLCQLLAIRYSTWTNEKQENSITHADFPASLGGIHHLPASNIRQITQSTQVKPHLCCNDPEWLFRAYQDTIVDVDSFAGVFGRVWHQISHLHPDHNQTNVPNLAPGPITSSSCIKSGITAEISWSQPWNLHLIGLSASDFAAIKYEVVLQAEGRSERQAYATQKQTLRLELSGRQNLIWIRCFVSGIAGPFPSDPLYC